MLGFDSRIARIVWTIFIVSLLLFLLYAARSTLLVVVFAIFFSYLVYPLIQLVERRRPARVPRTVSIALVFVVVITVLFIAGGMFGTKMVDEATRLGQKLPDLLNSSNDASQFPLPTFLEPMRERLLGLIRTQVQSGTKDALPWAQRVGLGVMHAASNLIYVVLIPVLSFLLIKEAPGIRSNILSWMPEPSRTLWLAITEDLDVLLSGYVRALLLLSMATLVCYSVAFGLMGVPYALLLAGIAAVLEFIPFVGPLAAVVLAVVVAGFSGYEHLLLLVGFILLYRLFQDYVLNPYLMSEGVEVSPLLVIVGLLVGEELGGVAGIFLSVPVMAAIKIILVRARASARAQPPSAIAASPGITGTMRVQEESRRRDS
ncbi:MAG: AI-2E family transporter [Herminiimonas sp.]|nr:AI-2E family transporter [Herminiimonas sp.]